MENSVNKTIKKIKTIDFLLEDVIMNHMNVLSLSSSTYIIIALAEIM